MFCPKKGPVYGILDNLQAKSVIVGVRRKRYILRLTPKKTLINCLAYIDLNPIRAGVGKRPEAYRWSSLRYHVQTGNKDPFFSMDFRLKEFGKSRPAGRLHRYRNYVYEAGALTPAKSKSTTAIDHRIVEKEKGKGFEMTRTDRFRYRTRYYFTDSGVIGTKAFVADTYQLFKHLFPTKKENLPKPVKGLVGLYSLKRLSEFL